MNDSGCELRALYAKNDSGLWVTWATLDQELRTLNAMNNIVLWLT